MMKNNYRQYFLLLILMLALKVSYAQTTKYYYFDENWNATTSSSYYAYYRTVKVDADGNFSNPITDYYRNGKTQCIIYADKFTFSCGQGVISCGIREGTSVWYNENGNISSYAKYKSGKLILAKSYNWNGVLQGIEGCESGDCENGYGIYYYKAGDKYAGYFTNGYRNGSGSYTWKSSGNTYSGAFKYNEIDKSQRSSYGASLQDLKNGLEVVTKIVELYKALTK